MSSGGAKCSQCGKPAIIRYDDVYLCVDCNLKLQQAAQLACIRENQWTNFLADQIEMAASIPRGWLVPRIPIPQSPFRGDNLILNNINVDRSTIGAINTGDIQRLDIAMTQMRDQGEPGLVEALKELTEAILRSQEIAETTKNELVEHLSFLAEQAAIPKENRSLTIAKTVFDAVNKVIPTIASLMALWNKVRPMLQGTLGI